MKTAAPKTIRRRPGHRPAWEEPPKAGRGTWFPMWMKLGGFVAILLAAPTRASLIVALIFLPPLFAAAIWAFLLGRKTERDERELPRRIVDAVRTHGPVEPPELSAILGVPDTRNFRKSVAELGRAGVLARHEAGYRLSLSK